MYRLLREHEQTRQRRAQATHPAKQKPELLATGPNQVWTWDITKLAGPVRGVSYDLYVILDIFSRKAIHYEVHPTETGELAKAFIDHAIAENNGIRPGAVHADRARRSPPNPCPACWLCSGSTSRIPDRTCPTTTPTARPSSKP